MFNIYNITVNNKYNKDKYNHRISIKKKNTVRPYPLKPLPLSPHTFSSSAGDLSIIHGDDCRKYGQYYKDIIKMLTIFYSVNNTRTHTHTSLCYTTENTTRKDFRK